MHIILGFVSHEQAPVAVVGIREIGFLVFSCPFKLTMWRKIHINLIFYCL
jgi:hypothetical protein